MPIPADIPPAMQERVTCSIIAAVKYDQPANIILAVASQENGNAGQWIKNTNGTADVGSMQFNTSYLRELGKFGITAADVDKPGCYPYELAAWRIRSHVMNDSGDLWTRVANYHSRTPKHNQVYRQQIKQRAYEWGLWLNEHFQTAQISQQSAMIPRANRSETVTIEQRFGTYTARQ